MGNTRCRSKRMKTEIKSKVINDILMVVGHPRSGTSLVCQLVKAAGITFPSDYEGDEFNKRGYFELKRVNKLSGKLIKEAMTTKNTMEMNKIVAEFNTFPSSVGVKIIKIPSLFFYKHISKRMRVIFIFRNPADVKASMLKRGIASFSLDWFTNNNALIAGYENIHNSIIISYETLLNNPERAKKIFEKIGLVIDPNLIQSEERTQYQSRIILRPEEKEMYEKLKELEVECFKLCGID